MTASSRRPKEPLPKDEDSSDSDVEDEDDEKAEEAKNSQREWSDIERVVREEKRLIIANEQFAAGNRGDVVVYDDAVGDEDASDKPRPKIDRGADEPDASKKSDVDKKSDEAAPLVEGPALPDDLNELVRHSAAVTAGQDQRGKKRGGVKETGGTKRSKKKAAEEAAAAPKKKDDPDRWVKLKLDGDKASKKIDATRVVHYHDFDTNGKLFDAKDEEDAAPVEPAKAAPSGNFRAGLRLDLFDPETDEEQESKEK